MADDLCSLAMALCIVAAGLLGPYGLILGAIRIKAMWRAWRRRRTRLAWSRNWEMIRRAFDVN